MAATPAWPPKSAPRLFVEQRLDETDQIEIQGSQAHYLSRVMRVSPDDAVILCDNKSGEWASRVTTVEKRNVTLALVELLRPPEPVPDFWLCPALLKKDRFDLVLEKATELGVSAIKPVLTRRCVADKLNHDRARSITIEAAEQCARTSLPELALLQKLASLLDAWPEDRALFFADEEGGDAAASAFADNAGPAGILVGPEGGFDQAEREMIKAHPSARAISLGPRILRGETAAIGATALWMGTAGDWGTQD